MVDVLHILIEAVPWLEWVAFTIFMMFKPPWRRGAAVLFRMVVRTSSLAMASISNIVIISLTSGQAM